MFIKRIFILYKLFTVAQWPAPPRKNCCRKYSELSNLHKIWNIVHNVNDHIEEKLGSEMFRQKSHWPLNEHCKYIRPHYDGTLAIHRKGQLISKCLFGVSVWTKNQRKNFQNFCSVEAKTEILVIFALVFCPNDDTKKTF